MNAIIDIQGTPSFLAHGGATTQVIETANGLRKNGIQVEYCKRWETNQQCDIIHSFGVPNLGYIDFAQRKGIPVVNTTLFTATCNRSTAHLRMQGLATSALLALPSIPPWSSIRAWLPWECYKACDLNVVGLKAEAEVLRRVYGVPDEKIALVPLGLSQAFLDAGAGQRNEDYLITMGTITERKRSLELARLAHQAKTPVLFVGKPYDEQGAYWREFRSLIDGKYVRHRQHTDSVDELIQLLHASRGYVLYSDYENWCLAAHEAVACGLPILLPDQPWSRELFDGQAKFFNASDKSRHTQDLVNFYHESSQLAAPDIKLYSWDEVGTILANEYHKLLQSNVCTGE